MAPTERKENSAFYPQCGEIPSSGIPLPERRDQSPFSQVGSLCRDPPLQREKSLSQPSSPWGEHVLNMLPKETACGSSTCRLYAPSTHPPEPISPRYPLRHVPDGKLRWTSLTGQFTPAVCLHIQFTTHWYVQVSGGLYRIQHTAVQYA